MELALSDDPKRMKLRKEIELPRMAKSIIEMVDPNREKLRKAIDEPKCMLSNKDKEEPNRAAPHTESDEPKRANPLRAIEAPR